MGISREIQPNIARLAGDYPAPYPPEWNVIQPKAREFSYPSHIAGFIWRAVYEVDMALMDAASHTEDGQLVIWKAPMRKTQAAQHTILSVVFDSLMHDDAAHVIGLLHGVTPAMATLWNADRRPHYRRRIHAIRMNGYRGTDAVQASMYEGLDENLAGASLIFLGDDVWDSGHVVRAVLHEIEKLRGRDHFSDEIIPRLHEERVVLAEFFYKDAPFRDQLHAYIEAGDEKDPWVVAQKVVLPASLEFGQRDWLMGEGLDTDIDGAKLKTALREILPDELYFHPKAIELMGYLEKSKVRIGAHVNGLIALNRSSTDDLIAFAAKKLAPAIEAWAHTGFRWEMMYPPKRSPVLEPVGED